MDDRKNPKAQKFQSIMCKVYDNYEKKGRHRIGETPHWLRPKNEKKGDK